MADEELTSLQNPRVKALVKLREGRKKDREETILVDGRREITRALAARIKVHEVYFCPSYLDRSDEADILKPAEARGARLISVSEAVLDKIGYGDRHDGIVVTATRPQVRLEDIRLSERPLVGIVEGVEKPGNLGAILRSADGAGIEAIIAVDPIIDIYSPNAIRASLGTIFLVPLVEASAMSALAWLKGRGISVVAASPENGTLYTEVNLTEPVAVVLGNEAKGLTSVWGQPDALYATVPMLGKGDSLNVSITGGLFFYEALRQRRLANPNG